MTETKELQQWLTHACQQDVKNLIPLAGDASFRRYYRLQLADQSFVVMDASIERASCVPFIAIANTLRSKGLSVPDIIASDTEKGFLLLTDFGDSLFLKTLTKENAASLYDRALKSLAVLQTCREVPHWEMPYFSKEFMFKELILFKEWFLERYLKFVLSSHEEKMLTTFFEKIVSSIADQPYVFMHRDYHSANLMVLPSNEVGVLDFQDAFIGPVTYDLVSLLRDCYIDWPNEMVTALALNYQNKIQLNVSQEEFLKWFDWMGLQRHMKTLLTFSRKYVRDQNSNYLNFIPRTLNYLLTVSARYPELKQLNSFFEKSNEVSKCAQ